MNDAFPRREGREYIALVMKELMMLSENDVVLDIQMLDLERAFES